VPVPAPASRGAGADVNAKDTSGRTPLLYAAMFSPNPEVVRALLNAGADPRNLQPLRTDPNSARLTTIMPSGRDISPVLSLRIRYDDLLFAAWADLVRDLVELAGIQHIVWVSVVVALEHCHDAHGIAGIVCMVRNSHAVT